MTVNYAADEMVQLVTSRARAGATTIATASPDG